MDDQTQSQPLGLTVAQFARRATLHEQTVRQLIREGRIRSVRVGRRHIVPVSELEALLAGEREAAAAR